MCVRWTQAAAIEVEHDLLKKATASISNAEGGITSVQSLGGKDRKSRFRVGRRDDLGDVSVAADDLCLLRRKLKALRKREIVLC